MFLLCLRASAIVRQCGTLSTLTAALAFALRYQGRKRVHNADEIMAEIVAKRLVEHRNLADRK